MLLKPEEIVLHRPVQSGGLSLHHVKFKALAGLIRTFLETACMPKYRPSLYHQHLFRYHVLDDRTIADPGLPPFYNQEFFSFIRRAHYGSPLGVSLMSEKQWYQYLLEEEVTMAETEHGRELIPCRAENKGPEIDWETGWLRARLPGLGHVLVSFLFKVMHDLLPTQERVSRTNPAVTATCKLCESESVENLNHALVTCPANQGVGVAVLAALPTEVGVDGHPALSLQLPVADQLELPVVWFLSVAWSSIWEQRCTGNRPELYKVRADLEAKVSILRKTRHSAPAVEITSMINML